MNDNFRRAVSQFRLALLMMVALVAIPYLLDWLAGNSMRIAVFMLVAVYGLFYWIVYRN